MATGFVWHERYAWHDTRAGSGSRSAGGLIEPETHAESPASKRRIRNLLEVTGVLDRLVRIEARPVDEELLLRVHDPGYVERIRTLSEEAGGEAGENAPFGRGSYEIARLAAGGCLAAVDGVLDGLVENAYALVRPPGHHATRDRGRGFCLVANVALAALHARSRGLERIAVVDYDVHHGNGTQDAFWTDPGVLTLSVHQDGWYPPDTGSVDEIGAGDGAGFNVNIPLPAGAGAGAYELAFSRVVVPALELYRPELVLVASGFDASIMDPLGRMLLHSAAFAELAGSLQEAAQRLCGGRIVFCHEGGYSTTYTPFCCLAVVERLAGLEPVEDPFLGRFADPRHQRLKEHERLAVEAAEPLLAALAA